MVFWSSAFTLNLGRNVIVIARRNYALSKKSIDAISSYNLVECSWLNEQIQEGRTKPGEGLKVLDCHFKPAPKPDPVEFEKEYYGKFDKLVNRPSAYKDDYKSEHITDAIFFDLQAAMYPAKQMRLGLYPPNLFKEYIRIIGIHARDHLVLYDRSQFGGMLFAAKAWWLLKSYGYQNVFVLNGGLPEWKKQGFETTAKVPVYPYGIPLEKFDDSYSVEFEELFNENGLNLDSNKTNMIDCRGESDFEAGRIPGFINISSDVYLAEDGKMKNPDDIRDVLNTSSGFDAYKPSILMCTTGTKTSLALLALKHWNPELPVRMYNGSMTEVKARAPEFVNASGPLITK